MLHIDGVGEDKEAVENQLARLLIGDSVEMLKTLPDNSVQMCLTSPPYDSLRNYDGENPPVWDFSGTAIQLERILVDGGIICWNVNDAVEKGSETLSSFKQAIFFVEQCGFRLHDTMIWHKPNFSNPSKSRYHQLFEYIFVLSKGKPRCFNPIKDKPNKYPNGPWGKNTYRKVNGEMEERKCNPAKPFGMRGNVWRGNTVGQERAGKSLPHSAMMPAWLARDLIASWSNERDTVIDPFSGSHTTCKQALLLNRKCIGIEKDPNLASLFPIAEHCLI